MAETAGTSEQTDPPQPLNSMETEERRKLLMESLRAGYPPIREVFRMVSANDARYITQITSGRWRERIHHSSDDSDTGDDDDNESEPPLRKVEPHKLVIYGFDLQSEEYRRETEMIMRWNIVEREQHFPNLETSYMEKRKAKNQVKSQKDVGVPQSLPLRDVAIEDPQVSPRNAEDPQVSPRNAEDPKTSPKSTKEVCPGSQTSHQESTEDVSMEDSPKSPLPEPQESPKSQASEGSSASAPQAFEESTSKSKITLPSGSESETTEIQETSANLQEVTDDSKEKASAPEDSKPAKSSESEMETSGTPLRGKRKADSAASSDGDDPDEKRTRKTSGDK